MHHDNSGQIARFRQRRLVDDELHRYETTAEYFASMAQLAIDYQALVCACRDHGPPLSGNARLALVEFQRKIEDSHYETFGTRLIDYPCADSRPMA